MGFIGFTEGIIVGIVLTCFFFVVIYARKSVIRESCKGLQLRSTVHRLYRQQLFLDKVGDQIHIIKLQGFMFFGTISQLSASIDKTLVGFPQTRFIVLDFSLLSGVDYSGLESFSKIKRNLFQRQVHLIFCGVGTIMRELKRSGILNHDKSETGHEPMLHIFDNLNESLEWCENYLLFRYYKKLEPAKPKSGIFNLIQCLFPMMDLNMKYHPHSDTSKSILLHRSSFEVHIS